MSGSSKHIDVDGFGDELDELVYSGASNWFITFRSLITLYYAHFSYLIVFFCIITCGILSFRHAQKNGKKFTQFWWGALIHGVISEHGINSSKYWHAQAPIMFFGKELPFHIVLFYPSIIYLSMMAVHRLKLNICTEAPAVGLLAMLMEIPFRMISVKFLHITYHDSDPMFAQKLCGVPWVEILSSLFLATSYVAVYHVTHFYLSRDVDAIWDSSPPTTKEKFMTVLSGVVSPLGCFAQKIVFFHLFQDFFNINPISCLFFVVSLYLSFVFCFEPRTLEKILLKDTLGKPLLFYQVILYLFCILLLALFGKPHHEASIGKHEPTGDCTTIISSRTPLGMPVKRKKYLCAEEVSERRCFIYNFDCLEEGPPCSQAIWYTICGSPIINRPQFLMNILCFTLLICTVFSKTLFTDARKQLEAAKRLILKIRSELRRNQGETSSTIGESTEPSSSIDEVTVGFVLVKSDYHNFKELQSNKEKAN